MSYSQPTRRPLITSEAPSRPLLHHIIAASAAMNLPLMALALISTSVSDLLSLPPIGAAMALIVGASNLPLAQPRNVTVGHLIDCTTGIAALHMLGSTIIATAVVAGVAFMFMPLACAAYSSAAATAMVTVLVPHSHGPTNDFRFMDFTFASSIIIVMLGVLASRLRGLRYPTYWWQANLRSRTPAEYGYRWDSDTRAKTVD